MRELFSKLTLMTTLEPQIRYVLYGDEEARSVQTMASRRTEFKPTPEATQEIDETFAMIKPYLKVL